MEAMLDAIKVYREDAERLAQEAYDATIEKGKESILNGLRLILSQYDLHNHEITIDGYSPVLYINGKHWDSSHCSVKFSSEHSLLRERQFPRGKDPKRPPIGQVLYDMAQWVENNLGTKWGCLIGEKLNCPHEPETPESRMLKRQAVCEHYPLSTNGRDGWPEWRRDYCIKCGKDLEES